MDFSAANLDLWGSVLQSGVLGILLLVGNILRRKIPLLQKSLLPTAVIGGFAGLLLRQVGWLPLQSTFLESVNYHMIAVGFIALGLRIPRRVRAQRQGAAARDGTKTGLFIVANYLIQGVLGLAIMIALAATVMPGLFRAGGLLLPMGYGQGPGQANNIGTLYETQYGFAGGTTFGLAIATMGFLFASIGGIIYLNYLVRRGEFQPLAVTLRHDPSAEPVADAGEIPLVEAVDKFTIQISLVLGVYLLTFLCSWGLVRLFDVLGLDGIKQTVAPLIWGFNFLIGSSLALGLRGVFARLRKVGVMTRQYPNNYLLNRISGFAFDLMIVASICAIDIGDLADLWLPFALLCALGGMVTMWYCRVIAKRIYPDYPVEGMLSMYGMMTGTVSTGILLLREVDPTFKTPAANNLVIGSSIAILVALPVLIMVGLAPQSTAMLWLTLVLAAVYAVVLNVLILRKTGRRHTAAAATAPAQPPRDD